VTDKTAPRGGIAVTDPVWQPWRPDEAARRLAGVAAPWYVAGGWALDLHRGRQSREHEDLEIGVPAGRFGEIRTALAGLVMEVVGDGMRWPVDSPAFRAQYQTWVSDPATGSYVLDVFREPHEGDTWICRRDDAIRLPFRQIVCRDQDGIPYLVPQIVLLFKAKHSRPKDEADFAAALPLLDSEARKWLRRALRRVHPGHAWIGSL
jgi:Aminoglycoside-2''-adenylyltransferase